MVINSILVDYEEYRSKGLSEREEWEQYGCSNRREWREHLNKQVWKDHTPDEKNGNYIGTAPERISWKRRHEND